LRLDGVDSPALLKALCKLEFDHFDTLHFAHWRFACIRNLTDWAVSPAGKPVMLGAGIYRYYKFNRFVALILGNSDFEYRVHHVDVRVEEFWFDEAILTLIRTFTVPTALFNKRSDLFAHSLSLMASHLDMSIRMLISYQLVAVAINTILDDVPELKDTVYGSFGIHHLLYSFVPRLQLAIAPDGYRDDVEIEWYVRKTVESIEAELSLFGDLKRDDDFRVNDEGDGVLCV
jgi:hypothetical protein